MFEFELIHFYIAALLISAVAVIAKAWFDYKSVRYQEDTKRLGHFEQRQAQLEPPELQEPDPEDD